MVLAQPGRGGHLKELDLQGIPLDLRVLDGLRKVMTGLTSIQQLSLAQTIFIQQLGASY